MYKAAGFLKRHTAALVIGGTLALTGIASAQSTPTQVVSITSGEVAYNPEVLTEPIGNGMGKTVTAVVPLFVMGILVAMLIRWGRRGAKA